MAIDAITSSTLSSSAAKKKDENSPQAIQDRFMSLLVAQLKNQDPLEPMDNSQVTSQMAQLNTVSGINNLNTSMTALASSFSATQTVQATTLLGKTILSEGNDVQLQNGKGTGALELKQTADVLRINIKDNGGNTVRSLDLGPQSKGIHEFDWDGKDANGAAVAEGNYKFEVEAVAAGQPADITALTLSKVQGVRNGGTEGSKLLTSVGTEVSLTQVKQVF
jgi:flagellar basal-body rod modification protein FlgD